MEKPNKPIERPASLDRFEVKKSKLDLLREKWRAEMEYLVTLPLPNLAEKAKQDAAAEKAKWTNDVPNKPIERPASLDRFEVKKSKLEPLREEKRPVAAPQNDLLMADWGK